MKVWLVQNVVAPYRIPLFRLLGEHPGFDFRVVLLAREMKNLPHWTMNPDELPFMVERVPGTCVRIGYENIFCLNPKLLVRLLTQRPNVIICAGFSFATLMCFLYRAFGLGRYVIWMEGTEYTESHRSWLRIALRRLLIRYSSALIDAGTLSRAYLKSLITAPGNQPFFTAYNAVEVDRFLPVSRLNPRITGLRQRFGSRAILYVGQLVTRKGVLTLLEVYASLSEEIRRDVALVVVGQGPLAETLKRKCAERQLQNVFLEGHVDYRDIPDYYLATDVFVLLSTEDPNPLVLFEALHAGLPVVCSNRLGNAIDFVQNNVNGYRVDPLNQFEIASKILDVLGWDSVRLSHAATMSAQLLQHANYTDAAKSFIDASIIAAAS